MLGIPNLEVKASQFEEDLDKSQYTPQEYVVATAMGKLEAVRDEYLQLPESERPEVILAADTVVECNGRIFEKPKSIQDNIDNIKYIRDCGVTQQVLTGLIILVKDSDSYKEFTHLETTFIEMDQVSDQFIELYCNTEEGLGVAGGYRIQGFGALFMKEIRGDYYNVVGLPYRSTFKLLQKLLNIDF